MTIKYIFDVDGTLTPSRGKINEDFRLWFVDFCINNKVYLVTGSDYPKTVEQLGEYLCRWPVCIFNCSGNDVWAKGKNICTNDWHMPVEVEKFLTQHLKDSKFVLRTGQHFDRRPGCVNFSILGRGATLRERQLYREWDIKTNERNLIVQQFREIFSPDLEISAGGETGVDIYPRGANKSQIMKYFQVNDQLMFFGDRMDQFGNDRPLANEIAVAGGTNFHVTDWQETWKILKKIS